MHLLLLGVNHRTAGLADREALAFNRDETVDLLRRLGRCGNLREIALLSTCNRSEFYVVAADAAGAEEHLRESVLGLRGRDLLGPGPHLTRATRTDVARHLFRVACGLDSMVLGDVQILGQVKDAFTLARQAETVGTAARSALRDGACTRASGPRRNVDRRRDASPWLRPPIELAAQRHCRPGGTAACVLVGAGDTARLAAVHAAEHWRRAPDLSTARVEPPKRSPQETGGPFGAELEHLRRPLARGRRRRVGHAAPRARHHRRHGSRSDGRAARSGRSSCSTSRCRGMSSRPDVDMPGGVLHDDR